MDNAAVVQAFGEYLRVAKGLSQNTVVSYGRDVRDFAAWCGKTRIIAADTAVVEGWLAAKSRQKAAASSNARRLTAVRQLYAFLLERGWAEGDPTEGVPLPKLAKTLPKALSVEQVKALLGAPLGNSPSEVRLLLILQLLYATGLRVSELCGLSLDAVADGEGVVLRVTGKGGKTRMVPLGAVAAETMRAYLQDARPRLRGAHGPWLLAGPGGKKPLTRVRVFQLVREAGARVGVNVAPHHLRHTFATHLLQNDADLRSVQLMLGHASLNTTQIYTKVAGDRLRKVLEDYHPLGGGRRRKQ